MNRARHHRPSPGGMSNSSADTVCTTKRPNINFSLPLNEDTYYTAFVLEFSDFEKVNWLINLTYNSMPVLFLLVLFSSFSANELTKAFAPYSGWPSGSYRQLLVDYSVSKNNHVGCKQYVGSATMKLSDKDWDAILREEENEVEYKGPLDMKYIPRNCMRQNQNFVAIREAAGKDLTNDVYVREPKSDTFWFVGKIARVSDVSVEHAVARQYNLIETHAANLRPIELFPARGSLEIWVAPGDSELEVAYNRPDVIFQKIDHRNIEGTEQIKNTLVGFQGEMYEQGEQGFRTWRLEDGTPARPEVLSPRTDDGEETRAPTEEEMKQLEKALEGKDINELYEEQERRKKELD